MSLIRYLILSMAMGAAHAAEAPLQATISWMAEAVPYGQAAIERHFGKVEIKCAGMPGTIECMASGNRLEMRWRTDRQGGEAHDGYASLALEGCIGRREIERVLGAPLRFSPTVVHEKSDMVSLAARYWVPGRAWNVRVTFTGDCAGELMMSELPF